MIFYGDIVFFGFYVKFWQVIQLKVVGNYESALVRQDLIVNEPVFPPFWRHDVIIHGLSEPPIVGDNEQVDQNNIRQTQLVNDSGEVHVTEDGQNDVDCIWVDFFLGLD